MGPMLQRAYSEDSKALANLADEMGLGEHALWFRDFAEKVRPARPKRTCGHNGKRAEVPA